MTGLFIGTESSDEVISADLGIYGEKGIYGFTDKGYNAIKSANNFINDVVFSGSPIEVLIRSEDRQNFPIIVEHKCLVQGAKTFMTRHDRVYYTLELVVISPINKRLNSTLLQNNAKRTDLMIPSSATVVDALNSEELREIIVNDASRVKEVADALGVTALEDGNYDPDVIRAALDALKAKEAAAAGTPTTP
jgi:hypothetical protein